MTPEDIEKRIIQLSVNTICYCEMAGKARCQAHKHLVEVASSLVAQAYDEAQRAVIENVGINISPYQAIQDLKDAFLPEEVTT
jgi:hypothetical protein